MCAKLATTREHAPPKCFFPESKDVGRDLRRNLVSVPACPDHNTARSSDDQYVMAVVVMQSDTEALARNQFSTKVIRTLKRSLRLADRVFAEPRKVRLQGEETIAVSVDRSRFDRVMASTCRALIFHHTGQKLTADLTVISPGILHKGTLERDSDEAALAFAVRRGLEGKVQLGENPEVFWYQYLHEPSQLTAIRLQFYGGFGIYVVADTRDQRAA